MNQPIHDILQALGAYGLKSTGAGKYRCISPFRSDAKNDSFSITVEEDRLVGCDHADGGRGYSMEEIAERLNVTIYRPVADTKRGYSGIDDYATAHGIPTQALLDAGWQEVDYKRRPALEFPTPTGKRWRFLDGNKPVYISAPNYQRCWFGLTPKALSKMLTGGLPLVLVNGEISALAGAYHGLPTACITGGEKRAIPQDLLNELMTFIQEVPNAQILVAMDCDAAGVKSAQGITKQLKEQGINVRAVDLGLGKGGDFADFCLLHGEAAKGKLADLPTLDKVAPTASKRQVVHITGAKKIPRVQWLVKGEIPRQGLSVLYGPSGTGKSFMALEYAFRLAEAGESVFYVAAEGQAGYRQRIEAWEQHFKVNTDPFKFYFALDAYNLAEPNEVEELLIDTSSLKPSFLVFDTLAMCMTGYDDNSARDVGKVITNCKTIQREYPCTILLVHHTNKGGVMERGSGALRGASDTMIRLAPEDDIIRVSCSKTKDAMPFPTRYMSLLPIQLDEETSSAVLIPSDKMISTPTDRLTEAQQRILEFIALGMGKDEIVKSDEIPQTTAYRAIGKLLEKGFVAETGTGLVLSDLGKKHLESPQSDSNSHFPTIPNGNSEKGENGNAQNISISTEKSGNVEIERQLPRYRIYLQRIELTEPFNTYEYIGINETEPTGWHDSLQLSEEKYWSYVEQGLAQRAITSIPKEIREQVRTNRKNGA